MARQQTGKMRALGTVVAFGALAGCEGFDFDLRDLGNGFDTSAAVAQIPARPEPDARGVISYPNYQVVVARQDDTVRQIAIRLGLDAAKLASYNGIDPDVVLRRDEVIALPGRVSEPAGGPISTFDVAAVAGNALDRAEAEGGVTTSTLSNDSTAPAAELVETPPAAAAAEPPAPPESRTEPLRHQVARGETVFSLSRLYDVPVNTIAAWNGLDAEFTIREGQFLLIPQGDLPAPASETVTEPGVGTIAPPPPSAATALPTPPVTAPAALPAVVPEVVPATPDLGSPASPATADARFSMPVQGAIIRDYAPGTNEGIDIAAAAGTDVRAAGSGTVAAVTTDTSGGAIVVIKHSDGLLTVYTQMSDVSINKDDSVSAGQSIGKVRDNDPSFLHFEVRRGLQSLDPSDYLN